MKIIFTLILISSLAMLAACEKPAPIERNTDRGESSGVTDNTNATSTKSEIELPI